MFFRFIGRFLSFVGKPFYFLLSRIVIALLFFFYIIGHSFVVAFKLIPKFKVKIPQTQIKKIGVKLPKIKIPSFKISLPKLKIPDINFPKINIKTPKIRLPKVTIRIKKRYYFPLLFLISFSITFYILVLKDLPHPKELTSRQQDVSTKIYDRNGILLYTIYKDKNRTLITLDQVPQQVRLATLAAEDAEFYSHPGFSIKGMLRALKKNISEGKLQGGSTITQQLVKNALLSSEKTYIRKIREVILAIEVEMNFSKDEILEMYLNEVSYGGTAYGIQEASQYYFGKNVEELNLSEASLLAGLPQSPTKYSPFGSHPEIAFSKQREVLHLMRVNRFITSEEENEALKHSISFAPNRTKILAPHFVMYVKNQLVATYGEELVEKGGLSVVTTLDYKTQLAAEKIVAEEVGKLKGLNVTNGSAIVLDPKNGEILAMVGSKDYFDVLYDGNVNVTDRQRQPGSSIKIINYAYALSNGYTLSSVINDSPITYNVPGSPPYTPKNYDGKYRGKITLRSALAESRNIPAVKILASYGVDKMIDLGRKMGITTWQDSSRFGLSLTLGSGEVKLIDLATVYATIANQGVRPNITTIKEVKNYKNKVLYSKNRFKEEKKNQVVDPRVAYLLIDVLKDNAARTPAFGSRSLLLVPNHPEIAVKTGTSNDLRDNLTVGFNQDFLVAVWVGNNNNSPMSRVASGITGASPIWNKIISFLVTDTESKEWNRPSGLVYTECFGRYEWYLEEKVQNCPRIIEPAASVTTTDSSRSSRDNILIKQVRWQDVQRSQEIN